MSLPFRYYPFAVDLSLPEANGQFFLNCFTFEVTFENKNFTSKTRNEAQVFSSLELCVKLNDKVYARPDVFVTINCVVSAINFDDKIIEEIKNENAVICVTTERQDVRSWPEFMNTDELEKYSKDKKLELILMIFVIQDEPPLSEKRLNTDFIQSETTYDLVFKKGKDSTINDRAMKVIQLLAHIYDNKSELLKMFVDNFQVIKCEGKWQLKHSCNFNFEYDLKEDFNKLQLTQGTSSVMPSKELFEEAARMEFELIKNANAAQNEKKREIIPKSYVYFLLDPFIADNLQIKAFAAMRNVLMKCIRNGKSFNLFDFINSETEELFNLFKNAIFYVGLGRFMRSKNHFTYARKPEIYHDTNQSNIKSINKIWDKSDNKKGPIVFHIIEGVCNEEIKFREAYLMKKIRKIHFLNNIEQHEVKIQYVSKLNSVEDDYFLWHNFMYKAFFKFILEGEVQNLKRKVKPLKNEQE